MSGHHHHGHDHHGHDHAAGGAAGAVAVTLIVNLGLTAAKWIAFLITGSPSLFGEAAHSTADSLNPILLWIGHRQGQKPADAKHPTGHGRETFFWSLLAAQGMFLIGAVLTAANGIETVREQRVPIPSVAALVIIAVAFCAEGYSFWRAWKEIRRELKDMSLKTVLTSRNPLLLGILVENGVDMTAALLAILGFGIFALTGDWRWDAGFSFAIASVITVSTLTLMNRNRSLLIGEAAPAETLLKAKDAVGRLPTVRRVLSVEGVMLDTEHVSCRLRLQLDPVWFEEEWDEWSEWPNDKREDTRGHPANWTVLTVERCLADIRSAVAKADPEISRLEIEIVAKEP